MSEKQKLSLPRSSKQYVEILSYCLMPNHYHFQLKQITNKGIHIFMSNIVNAFTRYYNTINKRKGPLFLPVFHSQIAYSVEQFLHTCRYIHLNPVKDGLIKSFAELKNYNYCSYKEYIHIPNLCNTDIVMHYFNNDVSKFIKYLEDDVEHQKLLAHIKSLKKKNQFMIFRGNASTRKLS